MGNDDNPSNIVCRAKFFKVLKNLKEGDVVLFKTERAMSRLQRIICNSEYDHVGLVVSWDHCDESCCSDRLKAARRKAGTKAWHTLEAGAENGVQLHRLTPACLSCYEGKAIFRHLDISSLTEAQYALACASLHRFVESVLGAPYERNMSRMIRAANLFGELSSSQTPKIQREDSRKLDVLLNPFEMQRLTLEELPTVFCSELVAAAYMVMGFLPREGRPPWMYIPRDFSSKANALEFRRGVKLNAEIEIDCDDLSLDVKNEENEENNNTNSNQLVEPFNNDNDIKAKVSTLVKNGLLVSTLRFENVDPQPEKIKSKPLGKTLAIESIHYNQQQQTKKIRSPKAYFI